MINVYKVYLLQTFLGSKRQWHAKKKYKKALSGRKEFQMTIKPIAKYRKSQIKKCNPN